MTCNLKVLPAIFVICCGAGPLALAMPNEEDGTFLTKAAEVSRTEAAEATLVARATQESSLKQAAEEIAVDHDKASRRLLDLAKEKGVTLPPTTGGETIGADAVDRVGQSDARRIAAMLQAHEDAVALFHQEAVRGMDPDVARFAQATLPTLQKRLEQLRKLQAEHPERSDS